MFDPEWTREQIASMYCVPPYLLGPPPPMRTPRERGEVLRAYARHQGLDFDDWPEEAQRVEVDDQRHLMGLDEPQQFGSYPTVWESVVDFFRWPWW